MSSVVLLSIRHRCPPGDVGEREGKLKTCPDTALQGLELILEPPVFGPVAGEQWVQLSKSAAVDRHA
ncbi:unnamed protein product [Schistocephalus solidus]|uniref:Antibiotic biosynthesis monooxygenase n=1 Tax=Schistocephalus solidus TaxID=70667 RepID=A0A183SP69_SCHSO|nr:unnamed protein product [Schistocephalus solidus]